jgi:hypothetical protein
VFEDKYADLFGRPEVTADRIVLLQAIMSAIAQESLKIENVLFAKYKLTRYFLLYLVREILNSDELGKVVITGPEAFVRAPANRAKFSATVGHIVSDIITDLNAEVKPFGDDFDYRDKLRDAEWVKKLAETLRRDREKLVNRGRIPSFKEDWEKP